MLSKNKIKYIHSLDLKKNRKEEHAFVAEGHKLVGELLGHFPCKMLLATHEWLIKHPHAKATETIEVTHEELTRASLLKTPQDVLAVFSQPDYPMNPEVMSHSLCLALDDVQDPGNLGTIIRTGEGAGISGVVVNKETVDLYNPKTIRGTMGSIYRIPVVVAQDLVSVVKELQKRGVEVFAAHLKGTKQLYDMDFTKGCAFLIGNEGNGLTDELSDVADTYLRIPMEGSVESLNAGVAASLLMYETLRQRGGE